MKPAAAIIMGDIMRPLPPRGLKKPPGAASVLRGENMLMECSSLSICRMILSSKVASERARLEMYDG